MSEQIITKTCRVCKQEKPISEFPKRSDSKDGYRNDCKMCVLVYQRSEKGKASIKRYSKSEKRKIARNHYQHSKKGKTTRKRWDQSEQGIILRNTYWRRSRIRHPEQRKAGNAINHAIVVGRLPRPDSLKCSCGEQAKHYHHPSYALEHHFDVIPVCIQCHFKLRLTS